MLKTWDLDRSGWKMKLSQQTTVCRADTDVGAGKKPWFIYLAQTGKTRPVRTGLRGKHVLLDAREARALVQYLLDSNLLDFDAESNKVLIAKDA